MTELGQQVGGPRLQLYLADWQIERAIDQLPPDYPPTGDGLEQYTSRLFGCPVTIHTVTPVEGTDPA